MMMKKTFIVRTYDTAFNISTHWGWCGNFSPLEMFFMRISTVYEIWKMKGKIDIKILIYFHSLCCFATLSELIIAAEWVFSDHKSFISSKTLNTINDALRKKAYFDAFSRRQFWFSRISFWHWWKIKSKAIKFNIGWRRKLFRKHVKR